MLQAGRRRELAVKALILIVTLWATSIAYCSIHEAAHATVAAASGGEIYGVQVSVLGDSGRTAYSPLQNDVLMTAIYASGLMATTILALSTLCLDIMPVTVLIAVRTTLSALNYGPGTDMARVQALAGEVSIYLTIMLVMVNVAVIAMCVRKPLKKLIAASSSLSQARPAHNSPE